MVGALCSIICPGTHHTVLERGDRTIMAGIGRPIVVLAADVVGYSSRIGADEEGTLGRLEAHRHQFVYPKVAEHCGCIVRAADESLLVEFASPIEAVRCAVEVQRGIIDRNIGTAPDRR